MQILKLKWQYLHKKDSTDCQQRAGSLCHTPEPGKPFGGMLFFRSVC